MKTITENNKTKAIKIAREYFNKTNSAVCVENKLGDPIIYITKSGKEYVY